MIAIKTLESLTPADIGRRIPDEHSLYGLVKPRAGGVAVLFRWRYRIEGKLRDYTCGTWPARGLPAIRRARKEAEALLAEGKDPNEARRNRKLSGKAEQAEAAAQAKARIAEAEALQARITVADLFERWATVELIRRRDGGKEIRRMFRKDVLPIIGALAVEDVRKGHITAVTDALLARGVTRMAKLIFALIRQMFRFAVDRDIIEADPTATIRKAKIGGKDTERERVLKDDEIRALHRQMPEAQLFKTTEAAIWITLATACRIGELLRAQWKHVRLDAREWLIPAENSKNGRAHTVYLSDFAIRHFEALQSINGASKWCFPNRDDTGHVCVKTVTKQIGDRQRGDLPPMSRRSSYVNALALHGGRWTPHDLRRTAATTMTALGVLPEVAERCLNHAEESRIKRTYQRHSYEAEKREAWRLLGERLELLTRDDAENVIAGRFVA
ncbi:MAG: tyrosine-type recombinase/integrase [Sulfuritalea sp.]|nr:tyrosine-type recombinase/integrase [Sulfuritalea sp.]